MNSVDPFEAANQRYEEQQRQERKRIADLRGALRRHGIDIESKQLSGYGLSGRIWFATSPCGFFFGELRLRTRAIERFVTAGIPSMNYTARIVLTLVERHLNALREREKRRRDDDHGQDKM
jgi:hypothetical protein